MVRKWISWLLLTVVFVVGVTGAVSAKSDYPSQSITYIIPFNPGGQSDLEARRQQPYLESILGVDVVVTYKVGAGGAVGWTELAQAQPDGYTISGNNIPHIILQPLVREDAGYRTEDLEPIAMFQNTPIGLAVKKDSPFDTLAELIAYAKANPGAITVGGSGTYSGHHIAALQFQHLTGTKVTYIPFTGAAPQMAAFLGGHVMAIFGNSNDLVQHKDVIKVLAIGSENRFEALPDVPTFIEQGLTMTPSIDRGVAAPVGISAERVALLEKAFLSIVNKPEIRRQMVEQGFVPVAKGATEFKAYIQRKQKEYRDLLMELDILK